MTKRQANLFMTDTSEASLMMLQSPGSSFDKIASGATASIIANLTATTDPGPTNDVNAGYSVGSVWLNASAGALRWWECRSNAAGAAAWVFGGADYVNGGSNPSSEVTQFGSGTAQLAEEGNVNRVVSAGTFPSGSGADYVVAVYALPGNSFDVNGRGITITAQGSFAANLNSRRVKIIYNTPAKVVGNYVAAGGEGGTVICDTGSVSTVANGSGWSVQANVFKYGIANSNTQIGIHQQAQVGGTVSPMLPVTLLTATENATIYICITANVVTSPGDAGLNLLEVNACN